MLKMAYGGVCTDKPHTSLRVAASSKMAEQQLIVTNVEENRRNLEMVGKVRGEISKR